jgi:exodeoxyribonuclease V beta subunit
MENSLSNKRLEALLEDHGDYAISGYKGIPIHGMLQGAIDLIFCHNDKYYLADYKSNHLGDSFDSYLPEKLSQSIQEKGYRLQFLIYSLALHLHLKQRKEDYQYEKHFGGVYYLYLRGMHPEHTKIEEGINTGVFYDLPPKELIEKLEHFFSKTDEKEGVL